MLPDEEADLEQLAVLRAMTPERRWQTSHRLYWSARGLKAAFLQSEHPEWSAERVEQEVRRAFLHARS